VLRTAGKRDYLRELLISPKLTDRVSVSITRAIVTNDRRAFEFKPISEAGMLDDFIALVDASAEQALIAIQTALM
jgi:hypothetical protein